MDDASVAARYHFDDFTEAAYEAMLRKAAARWAFEPFGTETAEAHLLWRHDVDCSVHRARRLADIESEVGVRSTYFLLLHSDFYNLMEAEILRLTREIVGLGHWLGLHFDPAFYGSVGNDAELAARLEDERRLLCEMVEAPVSAVSFHTPGVWDLVDMKQDELAGMVNAYGTRIRDGYSYVSDSNGYWRFRRLPEVIEEGAVKRMHVLTHPVWWQREAMSPRKRLLRAIDGRAASTLRHYDEVVANDGRRTVG